MMANATSALASPRRGRRSCPGSRESSTMRTFSRRKRTLPSSLPEKGSLSLRRWVSVPWTQHIDIVRRHSCRRLSFKHFRAAGEGKLEPSTLGFGSVDPAYRHSEAAFVPAAQLQAFPVVEALRERAAREARVSLPQLEDLQLQRYHNSTSAFADVGPGKARQAGHYGPHSDTKWLEVTDRGMFPYPRRVATWIFYLTDDFQGGETIFPYASAATHLRHHRNLTGDDLVGNATALWPDALCGEDAVMLTGSSSSGTSPPPLLRVRPRRNDAVLFYSLLPDGRADKLAIHASCPVLAGGPKIVAQQWIKEATFEVLLSPDLLGLWPHPRDKPDEESLNGRQLWLSGVSGSARCTQGFALRSAAAISSALSVVFWLRPAQGCRPGPVTEESTIGAPEVLLHLGSLTVAVDPCAATLAVDVAGSSWLTAAVKRIRPASWSQWALLLRKSSDAWEAALVHDAEDAPREFVAAPVQAVSDTLLGDELCVETRPDSSSADAAATVGLAELLLWADLPDDADLTRLYLYSDRRFFEAYEEAKKKARDEKLEKLDKLLELKEQSDPAASNESDAKH
eukprot:gnl/TRDRNA2_/TRDRNA2_50200_c0_seq1.p1 gnl/TRDRNA2_/TRDRNA2_50200_c0~~gnl/TRDRNA2_/TRDRNA2_50200_c0_seq1.p1  ORF type:complete len:568 (+),score=96.33 gnl/TRDRNA2_/TRDRNA2_50200_c0_seq1:81-1784(+)